MAKEQFERVKPHINQTVSRLQQLGISSMGARQALNGQSVTSAQDRANLAKLLSAAFRGQNGRVFAKYDGVDGESN